MTTFEEIIETLGEHFTLRLCTGDDDRCSIYVLSSTTADGHLHYVDVALDFDSDGKLVAVRNARRYNT